MSSTWRSMLWRLLQALPERELTLETAQGRLTISSHDIAIGRALFVERGYQLADLQRGVALLQQRALLQPGYLVDVGANIGTVAISLLRSGAFSEALVFEPEARSFGFLRKNIAQNALSARVRAFQVGLSSQGGELAFELDATNYGDHRIRLNAPADNAYGEQQRQVITVPVRPLDAVLAQEGIAPQQIRLLHIDVQGHEWHVLQGAQAVLATGTPVIMELWPYGLRQAQTPLEALYACLRGRYTHFYNLKDQQAAAQPLSALEALGASLSGVQHTDILLLNS
ncbi:MAG: FkbM family methyltransferase [Chloroflexi bacterium]|nr:FkbM family methyltransferase [Chloroflexota bacterium]